MLLIAVLLLPLVGSAHHATPDWTDHNAHDPGITLLAPSALEKEKGGTADINIGVGELWEDNRETDLATLRERARSMHETRANGPRGRDD